MSKFLQSSRFQAMFIVLLIGMIMLSFIACSPAHLISKDNSGILRNYLFSVEPHNNGTYTLWMKDDDVGAYCTSNKEMGERALKVVQMLAPGDITIIGTYRNREPGDTEYNGWGDGGCPTEGGVKYTNITVYKLLSFTTITPDGTSN